MRVGRGLRLAARKDLPPELRPPLQPVGQPPRRVAVGQALPQPGRLGLGGVVGQLRQQQAGAQQGQPGRHDVPLGQPRQRHLPARDRRVDRGGELLGQGGDGELRQVDPLRPGQLQQQVERALPGAEPQRRRPGIADRGGRGRDEGARRGPAQGSS